MLFPLKNTVSLFPFVTFKINFMLGGSRGKVIYLSFTGQQNFVAWKKSAGKFCTVFSRWELLAIAYSQLSEFFHTKHK